MIRAFHEIKRKTVFLTFVLVLVAGCFADPGSAYAAGTGSGYQFLLSCSGETRLSVEPEHAFEVTVELSGEDGSDAIPVYAVSYVMKYNTAFLEPDASGVQYQGRDSERYIITKREDATSPGWEILTVNIVTGRMEGSVRENPSELLRLGFTAKKTGITTIQCTSSGMSDRAGASMKTTHNDLLVVISNSAEKPDEPTVNLPFEDVSENAWYRAAVEYVYREGIMNGVSGREFAPESELTRAMMVQILYNMEDRPAAGLSGTESGMAYSDVHDSDWYAAAVTWASSKGIVNGYPDGSFAPGSSITREQTATILFRYAGYRGQDTSARGDLTGFLDVENVSGYASAAMAWTNARGIIRGVTETMLVPKGTATRAQIAQMMKNEAAA